MSHRTDALRLDRETVRQLSSDDISGVAGGINPTVYNPCLTWDCSLNSCIVPPWNAG